LRTWRQKDRKAGDLDITLGLRFGDRGRGEGRFRMEFVFIIDRLWAFNPLRKIEEVWGVIMVVRIKGD